jgi:photosystem II stability/assembly factor-like uncharacterized protein
VPALRAAVVATPKCELEWTARALPAQPKYHLETTPDGAVWVETSPSTLLASSDFGATYSKMEIPWKRIFDPTHRTLQIDPPRIRSMHAKGRDLNFTTSYQVFAVRNFGKEWKRLISPKMDMGRLPELFPSPVESIWADTKRVYFVENRGALQQSEDDGKTWSEDVQVAKLYHGAFLGLFGNNDGHRFIRDGQDRLLGTSNDGADWSVLKSNDPAYHLDAITVGPGDNALYYSSKGELPYSSFAVH